MKTRLSIADATNLACNEIYSLEEKKWIKNGTSEPALFITTELEKDEIQTVMIAFLSGVGEDSILDGNYKDDEEDRVDKAIQLIQSSPLYLEYVPDFDIYDIKRIIQRNVINNKVKYVFFDYIHLSHKMLTSIGKDVKGMSLREDIILLLFVTEIKSICNELGVFIMTATQLNASAGSTQDVDQNALRGAKSIAD